VSWFGKLIGGAFGFALGGPLGALIGAALGHNLDIGLERVASRQDTGVDPRERTQTAFFSATFSVMGHIAKADGRVTPEEIELAKGVMDQMGLPPELRQVARNLFAEGKVTGFPLGLVLEQLRRECHHRQHLSRIFLEVQIHAALADGSIHPDERKILERVCTGLRLPAAELSHIEAMIGASRGEHRAGPRARQATGMSIEDAYAVLGVGRDASEAEVKRAYRRLMNQHHPDKLVSKGLPEEMMQVAKERTQEIKAAYDRVREARRG
jgi:DnaJ like chaperone protein